MPGLFPNLLANGASGIAVGMATNIPPHNAAEVIGAALLLIERPDAELSDLLDHVKGPDFPTGGIVVESPATIAHAYENGRGGFRVRARLSTGKLEIGNAAGRGSMSQYVEISVVDGTLKKKNKM